MAEAISSQGAALELEASDAAGTGTISATGAAVTGVGTDFDTDVEVGDEIGVGAEHRLVIAIASGTALTLQSAFTVDPSGDNFTISKWTRIRRVSSLAFPSVDNPTIEVPALDSDFMEKILGLSDVPDIEVGLWFQPQFVEHKLIYDLSISKLLKRWRIWVGDSADPTATPAPDGKNSRSTFNARVKTTSVSIETNAAVEGTITLAVSGAPDLVPGVAA